MDSHIEYIDCPYCHSGQSTFWASEENWNVVRCENCFLLYVNPRPNLGVRKLSTELGTHIAAGNIDITERPVRKKIPFYKQILREMFSDVINSKHPITWIDIGAGYGEMVEAVKSLVHPKSRVVGLEPMKPKVRLAQTRGIEMISGYIDSDTGVYKYASAINIFSHINDFDEFLDKVRNILEDEGDLFIVTGDMSSVNHRNQFPGELSTPDHVVFASEVHLRGFLNRGGFDVVAVHYNKIDGLNFFLKNSIKKMLGRNTIFSLPFSSPYRDIWIRARKKANFKKENNL